MKYITLANGVKMPLLGLGTFLSENGTDAYNSVKWALEAGYRLIDTAQTYGNEESVGKAIKDSGIDRSEIFITTKLYPGKIGYNNAKKYFEESLKKLDTDYIDLYLIHWPSQNYELTSECWKAMEEIYRTGKARAIGVSNFNIHHLENLKKTAKIMPMLNQVELHPGLRQLHMQKYLNENNIAINSYGPLMKGQAFDIPLLKELSLKYNKSIPNIITKWGIQRNVVMIPKSVTKDRIIENFNVFDFDITGEDMEKINNLNITRRVYSDPDNAHFVPLKEII